MMNCRARILRGSKTEDCVKPICAVLESLRCMKNSYLPQYQCFKTLIHMYLCRYSTHFSLFPVCTASEEKVDDKVDFLGMSVDASGATAGQWILLVLAVLFLLITILLAYRYRKAKKHKKSASMMELK